jgi:WD domain, G-beta repeat
VRTIHAKEKKPILGVSFGEDGRSLAIVGKNELAYHRLDLGEVRHAVVGKITKIFDMQCHPRSAIVFFAPHNFDVLNASAAPLHQLSIPGLSGTFINSFCVSNDGLFLVHSQNSIRNNVLRCWTINSQAEFKSCWVVPTERDAGTEGLDSDFGFDGAMAVDPTISHDSQYVAYRYYDTASYLRSHTSSFGQTIIVRAIADGAEVSRFVAKGLDTQEELYPQFTMDNRLLMGVANRFIVVWDRETGAERSRITYPGSGKIMGLKYHPSGEFFVTVSGDRLARYWDAQTFQQTKSMKWEIGKLTCLDLSSDGTLAAAGGDNGDVVVWDV